MKLPDVNVLLFATNKASPEHEQARSWLESAFDAPGGVGLTWVALLGFVRLATRRGIFSKPLAVEDALSMLRPGSPSRRRACCIRPLATPKFSRGC
ncbi:MAG: hypothetical protein ACREVH_03490 [Gammaproteobacteria bacterium]